MNAIALSSPRSALWGVLCAMFSGKRSVGGVENRPSFACLVGSGSHEPFGRRTMIVALRYGASRIFLYIPSHHICLRLLIQETIWEPLDDLFDPVFFDLFFGPARFTGKIWTETYPCSPTASPITGEPSVRFASCIFDTVIIVRGGQQYRPIFETASTCDPSLVILLTSAQKKILPVY